MIFKELLVVIPHSGVVIPHEIPISSLSGEFPRLARNIDWHTNWLYDFRDILQNRHLIFPYCSLILEANRHPDILESSVPLRDPYNERIYKEEEEPDEAKRRTLSKTYLKPFNKAISEHIAAGAVFMFDGHSTVTARGVENNQIDLMNFQESPLDKGPKYYCPEAYIETYANELQKRLPEVKVTVNNSEYYTVYGHVCAAHSVNSMARVGRRVPALLQETNERLYKNAEGSPDIEALNRLRRAFAESLYKMYKKVIRRK